MLLSLEQSLQTLPNSGLGIVRFVDIYLADSSGGVSGGCPGVTCNHYDYTPGALGCDWTPCPDPALGYGGWPWAPTSRDDALPDLDVMGVRLTFAHDWITGGIVPLPNVSCTAPFTNCWVDTAVMRLEPQVFEP